LLLSERSGKEINEDIPLQETALEVKVENEGYSNKLVLENLNEPNPVHLSQKSQDDKSSLLSASSAPAETRQSPTYYKLLCPVYIADPDAILEKKEEEQTEIEVDVDVKKDEEPVRVKLEADPVETQILKERKSSGISEPRTKESTGNLSTKTRPKQATSTPITRNQKSKRVSSSSDTGPSSTCSSFSSETPDSDSSSETLKTVSLERRSKKTSSSSRKGTVVVVVVLKGDAQVHTHAEVDENIINVIGSAEDKGAGNADLEVTIHGAKDQDDKGGSLRVIADDIRLDIREKEEDGKEISLQAILEQKLDIMNQKKM